MYAATLNDSGAALGQFCFYSDTSCYWFLANDVNCKDDSKYPVLINSDAGSFSLELVCMKSGSKPRYGFTEFSVIDKIIRDSSRIGIAFPMESGMFQVSRFSLIGSVRAIDDMRKKFGETSKRNQGTRDSQI